MDVPRRKAGVRSRPGVLVAVVAGVVASGTLRSFAPSFTAPRLAATTKHVDSRPAIGRGDILARAVMTADPQTTAATDSKSWVLPTVDKDTTEFHRGVGSGYAWVQTSSTLYLFTPAVETDDGRPQVNLDVTNEGTQLRLSVAGVDIINGPLKHAVKPGDEIWMIEDAADGRSFVVAELEKNTKGIEWTSVLQPVVSLSPAYSQPVVIARKLNEEEVSNTVEATIQHLRRKYAFKKDPEEGYKATPGDLLTIDMQAYELQSDGSRGAPLDGVGSAEGMKIEVGLPGALPKEMLDQLVGIESGETRDVQFTLGKRGGDLAGQKVIVALTCTELKQQQIPELNDEFAVKVKQAEQFAQAGTAAGIPREEYDTAATFTLEKLRAEIHAEVMKESGATEQEAINSQLEESLHAAAAVKCEWANLNATMIRKEELASITEAIMEKDGLEPIDMEELRRLTWDELGKPKNGETHAEVGSDPDREFQEQHEILLRQHRLDRVFAWLEGRAEFVEPPSA